MNIKHIKIFFIGGIALSLTASVVEVFLAKSHFSPVFFGISMIGHCIFAIGLWLIDKIAKSVLFNYYLGMMIISFVIYCLYSYGGNMMIILLLNVCLLLLMFMYLHKFSKISGEILFIRSFYLLIFCFIVGLCVLKFGNIVENQAIVSFIIGFMAFPALIAYIAAILNIKKITNERFDRIKT